MVPFFKILYPSSSILNELIFQLKTEMRSESAYILKDPVRMCMDVLVSLFKLIYIS